LQNDIKIRHDLTRHQPQSRFRIHTNLKSNIAVLHLVPGFDDGFISHISHAKLDGLVLHLYGTGNAPSKKDSLLRSLQDVADKGTAVVAVSQCMRGSVDLDQYEVGNRLKDIGVINGGDMTIEAATTKLSYLLSRNLSPTVLEHAMRNSLRGERSTEGEKIARGGKNVPFLLKDLHHWAKL